MTSRIGILILFAGAIAFAPPDAAAQYDKYFPEGTDSSAKDQPVVAGIAIFGNEQTQEEIILREMTLQVGDKVSFEKLLECKMRIYNLGLFNSVDISYPPMDSTVLVVDVSERWYFFPVPLVGIVDRDWSQWYYGAGVTHRNFRGRAENIFLGGVLGYNPWVSVAYSNPWVFGNSHFFTGSEVKYQQIENKNKLARGTVPEFDEFRFSVSQNFGKRLDDYRRVWLHGAYNYVEVTDPTAELTVSDGGIDRYFTLGIAASHDSRDIIEYPMNGINSVVGVTKKGIGNNVDYVSYSADLRIYRPLFSGTSLGMRVFSRVVSGPTVPDYENVFFGFGERIRGHFSTRYEGQNILGLSLEYRIPIIKPTNLQLSFIPIPQFNNFRFGLYAAAFFDAGKTWYKHERVNLDEAPSGYGAGIHLLLPYGFVFRFDYAFNNLGEGEPIFDVKASF
ncbi:MAG: hypothetical protein CL946_00580 [Ectothiorhodospiraceae bacterium]|nr:hypothetical protein [Ectothiorhodospiraceae bacterium]